MSGGYDEIVEVAKGQRGYVATYQIPDISTQLISHHVSSANLERVHHGIYRVTQFPVWEDEEFVIAYLWSREEGVISHTSALAIHELSDSLPSRVHITLPADEEPVRRQIPDRVEVHYADIPEGDRQWYGAVPVTTVHRTLIDIAVDAIDPDLFDQALSQAKERGLVPEDFERKVIRDLIMRLER